MDTDVIVFSCRQTLHDMNEEPKKECDMYRTCVNPSLNQLLSLSEVDHVLCQIKENGQRGGTILLIVHGFNDIHKPPETYLDIKKTYSSYYDATIGFLWPSGDNALTGYPKALSYTYLAAKSLRNAIIHLLEHDLTVDIMCMSLGCKLTIECLSNVFEPAEPKVRNVWLMGAAIGNESFLDDREYPRTSVNAEALYVFWSHCDGQLKRVFPLAERVSAYVNRDKSSSRVSALSKSYHQSVKALGLTGSVVEESENVPKVKNVPVVCDHTEYWKTNETINFIKSTLTEGFTKPSPYDEFVIIG